MDSVSPVTPPGSARMSPCSPPVVSVVSSVAISPNRVHLDISPVLPDAEPVLEVSPDTSGFLMRPSGAAVQAPVGCLPLQPGSDSYCDPALGDPVAFPSVARFLARMLRHDISCLSAPFWTCIIAGAIFCSDDFGIGSFFAAGWVVLRCAMDL